MTTKRTSDPSNTDSPNLSSESARIESTLTLEAIRSLAQAMKDFELSELELTQPSGERLRLCGRRTEVVQAAPVVVQAAPVVVAAAAFYFGRRRGKLQKTVVEIRRV